MEQELEKYRSVIKKDLDRLENKMDRLQKSVDKLSETLYKHIEFIDSTYEGLKNPIEAARKWLRR
jgi:chaperonin cofactor prefoldin